MDGTGGKQQLWDIGSLSGITEGEAPWAIERDLGQRASAPGRGAERVPADAGTGALVAALAAAFLPVLVVNPRQVRDFAKATGRLAKTDSLDGRSWLTSPRPFVLPCVPSGTLRPRSSTRWWPADNR